MYLTERVAEIHPPCKEPFLLKGKKQKIYSAEDVADSLQGSALTHFTSLTLGSLIPQWSKKQYRFFLLWLIETQCWLPPVGNRPWISPNTNRDVEAERRLHEPTNHPQWSLFIHQPSFRGVIWTRGQTKSRRSLLKDCLLCWFGSWQHGSLQWREGASSAPTDHMDAALTGS